MPQVPQYGGPKAQQGALPNARVSVESPSFGLDTTTTEAVSRLDRTVQQYAEKAIDDANTAAVTEAYINGVKRKNYLTYSQEEGFSNIKGKNALEAIGTYNEKYNKELANIESGLSNRAQQAMFQRAKARLQADFDEGLQRHGAREFEAYSENQFKSGIETLHDDSVLNYHNLGKVSDNLAQSTALIVDRAAKQGYAPSDPFVQDQIRNVSSKTHKSVIQRMVANGDDMLAKEYYSQVNGGVGPHPVSDDPNAPKAAGSSAMTAEDRVYIEGVLKESSMLGESQRQATMIMQRYGNDLNKALDAARQIPDPKTQAMAVSEIKTRFSEKETAKNLRQEKIFEETFNYITEHKALPNGNAYHELSPSQKTSALSYMEHLRRGIEIETPPELYSDLQLMSAIPERQSEFVKYDLVKAHMDGLLSKKDFEKFTEIKKNLLEKNGKSDAELGGVRERSAIVTQSLNEAGIDPSPKPGSDDAKAVAKVNYMVDQEIAILQKEEKRKATSEEIQRITDRILMSGEVKGAGWFGMSKKKRAFELKEGEKAEVEYDDIPLSERMAITKFLKANGKPVSEKAILDWFIIGQNANK